MRPPKVSRTRLTISLVLVLALSFVSFDRIVPEAVRQAVPGVDAGVSVWEDQLGPEVAEASYRSCWWTCTKFTYWETRSIAYGPYPLANSILSLPLRVELVAVAYWLYYRWVARWALSNGRCFVLYWHSGASSYAC